MILKIDVDRMSGGKEVARRLRGSEGGGIPWMVILDAQGEALVTSDGPNGNCGYPVLPQEVEHFISMLKATATRLDANEIARIEQSLNRRAEPYRRR